MFDYRNRFDGKSFTSYKCRVCKVCLSTPDELRIHSMVNHKGHLLLAIKQ
jgi:hypothetical protein